MIPKYLCCPTLPIRIPRSPVTCSCIATTCYLARVRKRKAMALKDRNIPGKARYMAGWNIQKALDILLWLQNVDAAKAGALIQTLDLSEQRLDHWHDVINRMRIPQDKETGLFEQFDGFFHLEPLDQEAFRDRKTSYQGI